MTNFLNSVLRQILIFFGITLVAATLGCISGQENFKNFLYKSVNGKDAIGSSIDDPTLHLAEGNKKYLIETRMLDNGNMEYVYRWRGTCRYMYEVDPKTRIIVNARYDEANEDCTIPP